MLIKLRANFIKDCWRDFWFQPSDGFDLSLYRLFFFSALAFFYYDRFHGDNLAQWAQVPDEFWKPVSFFKLISLHTHSEVLLTWVSRIWFFSLLFSAAGLFTSWSTKVSFFLGIYNLGYPQNFGKLHHSDHMVTVVLGILAWSYCGQRFSLDAWLRKIRRSPAEQSVRPSPEFFWPVQLIRVAMCLAYMSSGFQKLRFSGLQWIFSDNLANILLTWAHPPGVWVATHLGYLCPLIAATTFFGELLAPLALFNRRAAAVIIPDLFFFHLGSRILMGLAAAFTPWMICFIFWIPLQRIFKGLKARGATGFLARLNIDLGLEPKVEGS